MPSPQINIPLPASHVIDGYRFKHQLSMGGFSIVYLATDGKGQPVAIKEYLPQALARRDVGLLPQVKTENREVYQSGMMAFCEEGRTLHEQIRKYHGQFRESFVRGVFARLLSGLREVHANKLLHLDIKPSNIYLRADGSPVLIDFGAACQTLTQTDPELLTTIDQCMLLDPPARPQSAFALQRLLAAPYTAPPQE